MQKVICSLLVRSTVFPLFSQECVIFISSEKDYLLLAGRGQSKVVGTFNLD